MTRYKIKMSNSTRKFIRREKSRIRREILDVKEQDSIINGLYNNLIKKPEGATSLVNTVKLDPSVDKTKSAGKKVKAKPSKKAKK